MDAIATAALEPGKSFPLGASLVAGGANFSVFSKHASAVQLLLFDGVDDERPSKVIDLDPRAGRTYHYWHTFVPGLQAGQLYGYRAHGPYIPEKGLRFDAGKVLLDPYGKCVAKPSRVSRSAARSPGDNAARALKSVLADPARRSGRRPSTAHAVREDDHLRAARRQLHPPSQLSHPRRLARHIRGTHREAPVSARPRRERARAPPGIRLR